MKRNEEWEHPSARANGSGDGPEKGASVIPLASNGERGQQAELKDKTALIVGGATARGQSLARAFAERGIDVAIVYFNGNHEGASAVKREVVKRGRRCILISAEAANQEIDQQFALEAMGIIVEAFGHLDIFINLSAQSFPVDQLLRPESESQAIRQRLFPQIQIMKAAINQILN